MTVESVKNILTGKTVKVPASGRIVAITCDKLVNNALMIEKAEWSSEKLVGIVICEYEAYDPFAGKRVPTIDLLALNGKTYSIVCSRIVKATATRSVPAKARETLTSIWKWRTRDAAKWEAKEKELKAKKEAARVAAGADDPARALADSLGTLSENEFEKVLFSKLSKALGGISDEWELSLWSRRAVLYRSCGVSKYYTGALSYLDYDDCRVLEEGAEKTEEGQRYIRKCRKELPVKAKLIEELSLEDKGWLTYEGRYELANIEEHELLTEQLAEDIVAKVVLPKKTSK